jgi:hypothetical protein
MVGICVGHLVGLHDLVPFSPRLRRLVIRFIEIVGYKGFEGAGVERLVELLDHLHVTVEDMDMKVRWTVTPLGCDSILRGNPTLIPSVLGITGGTRVFGAMVAGI